MIVKISDNIFSPLGDTSIDNYRSVKAGQIGGKYYEGLYGLPNPCFVSLIDNDVINELFNSILPSEKNPNNYTRFEKMMLISAVEALHKTDIDVISDDVIFVLSTTKGNIRLLEDETQCNSSRLNLWSSAEVLAEFFNLKHLPIVVSNACISGVAAQILAMDYLNSHRYKYAVVIGAEELSRFIISGFQSFKALSDSQCKPFDANRTGLNLGEAAATIIYQRLDHGEVHHTIQYLGGGLCNDANHISAPSRVGEGLLRAFNDAAQNVDLSQLAFINAHGTATRYNDDMEATAIYRAGLSDVPVNSMKGYFGHTLGAAGVLETILSSYAIAEGIALKTAGYNDFGVVQPIHVNTQTQSVSGNMFVKLISGFGGSNAAALFQYLD